MVPVRSLSRDVPLVVSCDLARQDSCLVREVGAENIDATGRLSGLKVECVRGVSVEEDVDPLSAVGDELGAVLRGRHYGCEIDVSGDCLYQDALVLECHRLRLR